MKIKTLIKLLVFAFVAYLGYGFAVRHFNRTAIAYKNYADCLARGDMNRAQSYAFDNAGALNAFKFSDQRRKELQQGDVKLSYYKIKALYYSPDGEKATIDAIQTVRVDPVGASSTFGTVAYSFPQHVQLEKLNGVWKVRSFEDPYTINNVQ